MTLILKTIVGCQVRYQHSSEMLYTKPIQNRLQVDFPFSVIPRSKTDFLKHILTSSTGTMKERMPATPFNLSDVI